MTTGLEPWVPDGWEKGQAFPGEEFVLHGFAGTARFTESWHPPRTEESIAAARRLADETFGT